MLFAALFLLGWVQGQTLGPLSPASIGPRRGQDEAQFLMDEARDAIKTTDLDTAARSLDRLIARYPGSPGYLEAHLQLGEVQLLRQRPALALAPLKVYLQAKSSDPKVYRARIKLAQAYFELGQHENVLALSNELLNDPLKPSAPKPSREERLEGLLIKAQAYTGMGETRVARRALDAFTTEAGADGQEKVPPALAGHWAFVEVLVQSRLCARLLPPGMKPTEAQAKLGVRERSTCTQRLLDPVVTALSHPQEVGGYWLRKSAETVESSWKSLQALCSSPPPPAQIRSGQELAKYQAELSQVLNKECEVARLNSIERLEGTKGSTHETAEFARSRLLATFQKGYASAP